MITAMSASHEGGRRREAYRRNGRGRRVGRPAQRCVGGRRGDVWADDEAKGTREQRDEKVLLDQVPPPVKATIERESAGGQVTGISQVATDDDPEMALLRRRGERQV